MTLKDRLGTCLSLIIRGKELASIGVAKIKEKFSNVFSFQIKEQNRHFEPEIRELKMNNRTKKAKKYSHAKDCKEQPRETCNQDDKKTIQPSYETQERLVCTYGSEETCKNIDEQYCHQVEKVVIEEVYASKSRRIPMLGSHPEGKEEGEMVSRGAVDGFQDSSFCFPVLYLLYVLNTSYRTITKMFNYPLHFLANFHIIIHYV